MLRSNPAVWPMLVIIDNRANPVAHLCLRSVSITRRFKGVVDAVVAKENIAYSNETDCTVPAKKNAANKPAVNK
jgi:hypothetical protein